MRIYTKSNAVLMVVVSLAVVLTPGSLWAAHPFLIVTEANFPALQALSSTSPWSNMKSEAISNSGLTYNPSGTHKTEALKLSNIVSGCALAYILDVGNRSTYLNRFYNAVMVNGWPDIISELPPVDNHDFPYCVITGGAFFNTVLALDVMYNGFNSTEITNMETQLQLVANYYNDTNHKSHWELNLYGCRGIWALYKGNSSDLAQAKADYRDELFNKQITTDGVGRQGPGYPCIRLSNYEREAKGNFMDVLTFTGEDNYYTDPCAINLMEWLYGYATVPFRKFYTFGDTAPNRSYHEKGASLFRAHRFSDKAGRYAAWINNGIAPMGRLLHYVLMDQPLMTPERGPSRIFPDGGAWFVEPGLNTRALSAALFNPMATESHAHKDVSAIHTAAYGEHCIRNSGYAGWNKRDWTYTHDTAYSNSTVRINREDHAEKYGNGIIEGFTSPAFDYACSDSGPAISNGTHYRNLLFIHPDTGVYGYWVLFDEFDANNSSHQANILLHPNANNMSTISNKKEYESQISNLLFDSGGGHEVYISMFLGTPPASASIEIGDLTHMYDDGFDGKYLDADYDTDGSGRVNIVTVLFPYDNDAHNVKATMTRLSGTGYTGASIAQDGGSVVDIALESAGTSTITHSGVSFQGLATWYRLDGGLMTSYFVREGQSFDDGASPREGFDSSSNVSIYIEDTNGRIVSPGTNVTFYYPGIAGVSLNGGPQLSNISSGTDWVQVNIPAGTHEVRFDFQVQVPSDIDNDGDTDFEDFAILCSQWHQTPGTPSADIAPPGGDNIVDIKDFDVLAANWLDGT